MREKYAMLKLNDRIELVCMPEDPDPVPVGTKGTIERISQDPFSSGNHIYGVKWDNGRTLNVCTACDQVRVIG
jgi:hypothetical protein